MGAEPEYNAKATAYIINDDRYKRACALLAEVLDLHPETVEQLGVEHDFIKATARLSQVKVMLALEWARRNREEDV